jgi:hypothetical protein
MASWRDARGRVLSIFPPHDCSLPTIAGISAGAHDVPGLDEKQVYPHTRGAFALAKSDVCSSRSAQTPTKSSQRLLGPQASLPRYGVIAELFDLSFPPLSGVANGLDKNGQLARRAEILRSEGPAGKQHNAGHPGGELGARTACPGARKALL